MTIVARLSLVLAVVGLLMSTGCSRPEDWTDPEYVRGQLEIGDLRAFDELTRLTPEQQASLVTALVDLYNSNMRREQAVQALVGIGDPAARDVFISALDGGDALAAQAARGLAAINDSGSATLVAQRLMRVAQQDAYAPFLEALKTIGTSESADVVAEMMMRQAPRIGGIATVRSGCELLGGVDDPSDEVISALVFGLVNFIPQPYSDALKECELALLAHGDRSVPGLAALLNDENQEAIIQLRSNQYRPIVGRLRAAAVLANLHTDAANDVLRTWFATPHPVPYDELRNMSETDQTIWYDQNGQLFTVAVGAFSLGGSDEDAATLRRLESTEGEDSLLSNFSEYFNLSSTAEFGLRTAVHDGLSRIGTAEDRELLWLRATEGSVARGGAAYTAELRKNALHYLGRTARPDEMPRFQAVIAANADAAPLDFAPHVAYFVLAELCADDVSCYVGAMSDVSRFTGDERVQAVVASVSSDEARAMATAMVEGYVRTAAVWQLALRFGDNPAAGQALVAAIDSNSNEVRANLGLALFYPTLPADFGERVEAFLVADADNRNAMAQEYRHALRVVRTVRQ